MTLDQFAICHPEFKDSETLLFEWKEARKRKNAAKRLREVPQVEPPWEYGIYQGAYRPVITKKKR